MQQQLAHVGRALAQAGVELVDGEPDLRRIAAPERAAQQLDLDLQEGQALGDRVVQLAREQRALLGHRRLALERCRAHALHAAGEVAGQGLEQHAVLGTGAAAAAAVEQVDLAERVVVQAHRDRDQAVEAVARASRTDSPGRRLARGRHRVQHDDPRAAIATRLAAVATAVVQAALGLDHVGRHAVGGQQRRAVLGSVVPAQQRGIGAADRTGAPHEALGQRFERRRTRDELAGLVEHAQPLALGAQVPGLLAHLAFEVAVEVLQGLRHAVEALRKTAELVCGVDLDAGRQVAALDLAQARLQPRQRVQHEQEGRIDHRDAAGDRQPDQAELEGRQHQRPARELGLDRTDEGVDVDDQRRGLRRHRSVRRHRVGQPLRAVVGPARLHMRKRRVGRAVAGHEQRPRRVAAREQGQRGVELLHVLRHPRAVVRGDCLCQPPDLHAQAAGFVDRCGAAFELPAHPQRQSGRAEREQQQQRPDGAELHGQ